MTDWGYYVNDINIVFCFAVIHQATHPTALSGCVEHFHLKVTEHARHTKKAWRL